MSRSITALCIVALTLLGQTMTATAGGPAETKTFSGACDASAALPLGGNRLLVVDDESKTPLKIYRLDRPNDAPRDLGKLADMLPNTGDVEADLEALAPLGDDVVFIASHNWHAKPKKMAARQLIFALPRKMLEDGAIKPAGVRVYRSLIDDLLASPVISGPIRDLVRKARTLDAKTPGGLSIEGLASTKDGRLLIGFRNPLLDDNSALLLPLANPAAVLHEGARPIFEAPIALDLGGRGIRDIVHVPARDEYLVIAGAASGKGPVSRAYWWSGSATTAPRPVADIDFRDFNPEGVAVLPEHAGGKVLFLSDDGKNADVCMPGNKRFRGRWYTLPLKL